MPIADTERGHIWYELRGSGPPLLQIGGGSLAHENFGPITDLVAEHFTVIDFDLPGYGPSTPRDEAPYSFKSWASDTASLLDSIDISRCDVHGTSMGGMVALQLAADYPSLVRRMVVSCTAARADYSFRARVRIWKALAAAYGIDSEELALELATIGLSRQFMDTEAGRTAVVRLRDSHRRICSLEVFQIACDLMESLDLVEELSRVQCPTLVLDGELDVLTPINQAESGAGSRFIADHLQNGELSVISNCGHSLIAERPEETVEILRDFMMRV